jgi:hypothetical protein
MTGNPRRFNTFDEPTRLGASDIEEVVAWCDTCREERRFLKENVDVSRAEEEAEVPDVRQALTGEEGWVCEECRTFHRDLPSETGYDLAHTKDGSPVSMYPENRAVRVQGQKDVRPPERIASSEKPPPEGWEATEEGGPKRKAEGENRGPGS